MKTPVLPNFIVIGAQRCATSWLYFCLKEHADVYVPHIKEIDYFSHYYDRGAEWYAEQFSGWRGQAAIGEVSPNYLFAEKAAARIAKDMPGARLIVSLRNPVDRAFSQYRKQLRSGRLALDFKSALKTTSHRYVERGLYYTQLTRYMELFPKERILVLVYEDLLSDPEGYLKKVFTFLGVDPSFVPSCAHRIVQSEDMETGLYHRVSKAADFLKRRAGAGMLVELAKKTGVKRIARAAFDRFGPRPRPETGTGRAEQAVISQELRRDLARLFEDENRKLAELLGRDLSCWR